MGVGNFAASVVNSVSGENGESEANEESEESGESEENEESRVSEESEGGVWSAERGEVYGCGVENRAGRENKERGMRVPHSGYDLIPHSEDLAGDG